MKPPISAVQNVTVGKESVLSCDFHGYPPPTSFGWTFNGQPADSTPFILQQTQDIGSSGEYVTTSHLNMEVHSVLFQGIYTCMAVGNSSLTKEFQYQVNTQGSSCLFHINNRAFEAENPYPPREKNHTYVAVAGRK